MRYTFEWDPKKARENLRKHRISFEEAAELFLDPLAISVLDEGHSNDELRWVTVGRDGRGRVLLLIHTFLEISVDETAVRIISARGATKRESRQYHEFQP